MTNGHDYAYPLSKEVVDQMDAGYGFPFEYMGMTKRELFAMAAMQGMLANNWSGYSAVDTECDMLAKAAVNYANALITALNKKEE